MKHWDMKKLALALLFVTPIASPAQELDGYSDLCQADLSGCADHYNYFNFCRPMSLVFDNERASEFYVSFVEDRAKTIVESRLRAARLYDSTATNSNLQLIVWSESGTTNIRLMYAKPKEDLATGIILVNPKEWGTMRGPGEDSAMLQAVSELMDGFINEYLRVNESFCD